MVEYLGLADHLLIAEGGVDAHQAPIIGRSGRVRNVVC